MVSLFLPVPGDASDPPYSQVTARESLASIRARQQQGQGMIPTVVNDYDVVDNVYEPVDDAPETHNRVSQNRRYVKFRSFSLSSQFFHRRAH